MRHTSERKATSSASVRIPSFYSSPEAIRSLYCFVASLLQKSSNGISQNRDECLRDKVFLNKTNKIETLDIIDEILKVSPSIVT